MALQKFNLLKNETVARQARLRVELHYTYILY